LPKIKRILITKENDATDETITILLSDHFLVLSFISRPDAINADIPIPKVQVIVIGFASTPKLFHHQDRDF
jgi:hypothetical protein